MTFFLLYYLTCALAVTKQLSHRNRASQHVSSPGDAGIQRWGHDEAAMQAGKPSKAGKLCNVVALWVLAFASMTHVCGGRRVRVSVPTRCGRASFPGDSHERHAVRQSILLDRRFRGGENRSRSRLSRHGHGRPIVQRKSHHLIHKVIADNRSGVGSSGWSDPPRWLRSSSWLAPAAARRASAHPARHG